MTAFARTVPRKVSEHSLQVQVLKEFEVRKARDVNILALANAGHRSLRMGARMKAEGLQAGAADLCIMLPGGKVAWLELKTSVGRQSIAQKGFESKCRRLGHPYAVARTLDEAFDALKQWGALKQ
jgi:hypothetical protein